MREDRRWWIPEGERGGVEGKLTIRDDGDSSCMTSSRLCSSFSSLESDGGKGFRELKKGFRRPSSVSSMGDGEGYILGKNEPVAESEWWCRVGVG